MINHFATDRGQNVFVRSAFDAVFLIEIENSKTDGVTVRLKYSISSVKRASALKLSGIRKCLVAINSLE